MLAQFDLVLEDLQLGQQDRGLQSIQTTIHTYTDVVISPILAVTGNLTQNRGQLLVAGEDGPAIAIATQRFAREEAGASDSGQVAGALALVGCTKALCGILDYRNAVFGGNSVDCIIIGALTIQRHRDNCLGSRSDGSFQQAWVQIVRTRIDIDINRFRPQ
ncbi:hypothetical protein D9M69_528180 [compost metagenome]